MSRPGRAGSHRNGVPSRLRYLSLLQVPLIAWSPASPMDDTATSRCSKLICSFMRENEVSLTSQQPDDVAL